MNVEIVDEKKKQEVEKELVRLDNELKGYIIKDSTDYALFAEEKKKCDFAIKMINELWEPARVATKGAYDTVIDSRGKMLLIPTSKKTYCVTQMANWQNEQRRIQEEAQREADRIAQEEKKRQEDELLKQAQKLAAQGKQAESDTLLEQPVYVAPAVVPKATENAVKTDFGTVATQLDYKVTVIDKMAFLKEITSGRINFNLEAISFTVTALKSISKNQGIMSVPGLRIEKTTIIR